MKLTSFTDYSLRVLIYLAAEPGRRATISEIAVAFGISENHLTKVVHFLGKQGWIATVRGKGGGMGLAQPPEQIVIGQVVRSTEGSAMPAECFDQASDTCPITPMCHLKNVLQEAVEGFLKVLDGYTLADLVRNRATLARVLKIQPISPPPSLRH